MIVVTSIKVCIVSGGRHKVRSVHLGSALVMPGAELKYTERVYGVIDICSVSVVSFDLGAACGLREICTNNSFGGFTLQNIKMKVA